MIKTLIVEDNKLFRLRFVEFLQSLCPDMLIEESRDGSDVLGKLDNSMPGIVFMDIRLPGANGLELTRKINADG